jgi:hypothetical protein
MVLLSAKQGLNGEEIATIGPEIAGTVLTWLKRLENTVLPCKGCPIYPFAAPVELLV